MSFRSVPFGWICHPTAVSMSIYNAEKIKRPCVLGQIVLCFGAKHPYVLGQNARRFGAKRTTICPITHDQTKKIYVQKEETDTNLHKSDINSCSAQIGVRLCMPRARRCRRMRESGGSPKTRLQLGVSSSPPF